MNENRRSPWTFFYAFVALDIDIPSEEAAVCHRLHAIVHFRYLMLVHTCSMFTKANILVETRHFYEHNQKLLTHKMMISHENYHLFARCLILFYETRLHLRSLIVLTNKPIQLIKESITVAFQGFIWHGNHAKSNSFALVTTVTNRCGLWRVHQTHHSSTKRTSFPFFFFFFLFRPITLKSYQNQSNYTVCSCASEFDGGHPSIGVVCTVASITFSNHRHNRKIKANAQCRYRGAFYIYVSRLYDLNGSARQIEISAKIAVNFQMQTI